MQQNLNQFIERFRCLRPKGHCAANARQSFGELYVGHDGMSFQVRDCSVTAAATTFGEEKKKRRMGSPQRTAARPSSAGMGSCMRIRRLITAHPARNSRGATGYHQRMTGSLSRKSDAADRARKQIAEKMMKERMRSKAPKQRTRRASPVCNRTAFAG